MPGICPYCKEPVTLRAYYTEGHVRADCPLTSAQLEQLGEEE